MSVFAGVRMMEQMIIVIPTSGLVARVAPSPNPIDPNDRSQAHRMNKLFVGLFCT